jgi:DNA-binding Xre family transcriptional regulator
VSQAAGLTPARLQRIRNGSLLRIRTSTATAILSVTSPLTLTSPRPATRTRQLLRWFQREGFTLAQLAARVGLSAETLRALRPTVRLETELKLSAFQRLMLE